ALEVAFLLLFAVLLWRLVRRTWEADTRAPIAGWGIALLLLALTLPYLLPWYAAWFVPFLVFLEDPLLTFAGVFACIVLACTLVPADPFHGLTTPAVMGGVHYGAASLLLLVLAATAARLRPSVRTGRRRVARVFDATSGCPRAPAPFAPAGTEPSSCETRAGTRRRSRRRRRQSARRRSSSQARARGRRACRRRSG